MLSAFRVKTTFCFSTQLSNTICKIIYLCRKLFRRLKLIAPDTVVCAFVVPFLLHYTNSHERKNIRERERARKNACERHSLRMIKSLRVSCWYINFGEGWREGESCPSQFQPCGRRWIIDKLRAGQKITIQMALCWLWLWPGTLFNVSHFYFPKGRHKKIFFLRLYILLYSMD